MYHFAEMRSPTMRAGSPIKSLRRVSVPQYGHRCGGGPQSAVRRAAYSKPYSCRKRSRAYCESMASQSLDTSHGSSERSGAGREPLPEFRRLPLTIDKKLRDAVVECRGEDAAVDRSAAGNAGPADSANAVTRTDARLGNRSEDWAGVAKRAAGGAGIPLSGAASPRIQGLDSRGLGCIGEQSASEVLLADARGETAARG